MPLMRSDGLQKAIQAAGSTTELARRLGISSQAISQWKGVPIDRVKQVEAATGVPRHELCPELWERPESSSQNAPSEAA